MGPSGSGLHNNRRGALAVAVVAHAPAGALTRVAGAIVLDRSPGRLNRTRTMSNAFARSGSSPVMNSRQPRGIANHVCKPAALHRAAFAGPRLHVRCRRL